MRKRAIGICLLAIGGAAFLLRRGPDSRERLQTSADRVMAAVADSPVREVGDSAATRPQRDAEVSKKMIFRGKYEDVLDGLCKTLTKEEKDFLLKTKSRSSEILAVLALMGGPERKSMVLEALSHPQRSPLALYCALVMSDIPVDKVSIAKELGGTLGKLYEADALMIQGKDPLEVLKALDELGQDGFESGWGAITRKATVDAFAAVGRDPKKAEARMALSESGCSEFSCISSIYNKLTPFLQEDSVKSVGVAVQLSQLYQNLVEQSDVNLSSYMAALANQKKLAEYIVKSESFKGNPTRDWYVGYLTTLEARMDTETRFLFFERDKPGIYQLLSPEDQDSFIDRLITSGDVGAYRQIQEADPQFFRRLQLSPTTDRVELRP